jgi:hypothetical protein
MKIGEIASQIKGLSSDKLYTQPKKEDENTFSQILNKSLG